MNSLTGEEKRILSLINEGETIHFLQSILQARSDAPPGDCRAVVDLARIKLESEGIPVEIHAFREHQPNLLACLPAEGGGKRLLFHAHIDTVPAGDLSRWQVDPFAGVLVDGRVYGRGAGDDKGSAAAQVMALVALQRAGVRLGGRLGLALVADEETGGEYGTRWLRQEGKLNTDALVVGEQTHNQVAIAERVACGIDLVVRGKSAHGATPWNGDNAVLKMARLLAWLEGHYLPKLAQQRHPYLPPASLNFGRISGGVQWNIVPEACKVEMDRRLLPGETRQSAMEELRTAIQQYIAETEPLDFDLHSAGDVAANIDTPPDDPFVQQAKGALSDLRGTESELTGYVQTSDGRWFAEDGIPIILFGPGDPALGHAANEFVPAAQVVEAARFLALLAARWLS